MQSEEWEGFQSFAEEPTTHLVHNSAYGWAPCKKQSLLKEESKVKVYYHKNRRKTNFKPTPNRKLSQEPSKNPNQKSHENLKPESRRSFVHTQASCNKSIQIKKGEEEKIPIYRFPNICQQGKLLYKGFLPIFANQYLSSYSINDEGIRETKKSMVEQSIRNSLRETQESEELVFNSKFENGNLDLVRKFNNEYHLYLAPDTNSKGHKQWFYFSVYSPSQKEAKFVIHGFKKRSSLFQKGMKPYGKKIEDSVESWGPVGSNVIYLKEEKRPRIANRKVQYEYCLHFTILLHKQESLEIASCIPYTYTYLNEQLASLQTNTKNTNLSRKTVLCQTLMGLQVPLITIGSPQIQTEPRFLIINGRTHPGQSSSSWVMQGILDYLFYSDTFHKISKSANLIIKIVPMLNPDGVLMGNYRTGVMGIDYNRLFLTGKPDVYPEVQSLKKLVDSTRKAGRVDLYLDLHGHSINPGCFMYGPDPCFATSSSFLNRIQKALRESPLFAEKHCKTGTDQSKRQTSRLFFQVHHSIDSVTCENSLGLFYSDSAKEQANQFDILSWKSFGRHLIASILSLYDDNFDEGRSDNYGGKYLSGLEHSFDKNQVVLPKSKTDSQSIAKHLESLRSLSLENIDLDNCPSFQEESSSINDSDGQSEDLSPRKQEQLIGIVSKIVNRRKKEQEDSKKSKGEFRSPARKIGKGQCLGNFKEYQFGNDQSTMYDWFVRRRLLSVPKVLKNEKINQSYIIRKTIPKPFSNDLVFESMRDPMNTIRTGSRQRLHTTTQNNHLNRYRADLRRQKIVRWGDKKV